MEWTVGGGRGWSTTTSIGMTHQQQASKQKPEKLLTTTTASKESVLFITRKTCKRLESTSTIIRSV